MHCPPKACENGIKGGLHAAKDVGEFLTKTETFLNLDLHPNYLQIPLLLFHIMNIVILLFILL